MYSYICKLKYDEFVDSNDIKDDYLNDVDRMLSRYFIRNDMTRYRRLTNLFGDVTSVRIVVPGNMKMM